MAGISSLGFGSGVLTNDLVDQLVAAERKPVTERLNYNQQKTEALISAYGALKSAITELRLPLRQLSSADNLKAFSGTSSNDDVSVSVDSTKASPGTYSVRVDALAQAQSLATGTFADKDTVTVGTGSLTISVGGQSKTLTIDSSNNTLQGLADEINEAGIGATAGVIDTGNGYRLVLSSEKTGVDNAVSISVSDDDGVDTDVSGLSQLAFDGTTNNLTETVAAQDAVIQINGIEITRSNNSFDDVIAGVSLEAKAEGATSTVTVSQDTGAVADRVQSFVDKYNSLQSAIKSLAGYNAEAQQGGLLSGDATVRNVQNQLRRMLTDVVPGLSNASVRSLADIGISTNYESGQLEFDSAKFKEQLEANPDDVTALFAQQGRPTDPDIEFVSSGENTEAGDYAINITQVATQGSLLGANVGTGSVTIDADNDELTFVVDGSTTASIQLTAGTYTREELAAEIQTQLNASSALGADGRSVTVEFDSVNGALSFRSGEFGSESNVSLTAVDTNSSATLGLSVATGTAGQDVAGTINGQEATGDGQVLSVKGETEAAGLQVRVTGGSTGSRGTISFIEGLGSRGVDLINDMIGSDGAIENRTDGLQAKLEGIAEERERFEARMESYRERLVSQFAAADSLISRLNSTLDFVSQQLAALAPQNNSDN